MNTLPTNKILTFLFVCFASYHTTLHPLTNPLAISTDAVAQCYTENDIINSWKYLEFYFVVEPNNQIQAASMGLSVKIGATISGLFLLTRTLKSTTENSVVIFDPSTLITTSVLAAAAGYWYNGTIEMEIKKSTLLNFLANWSYHRNCVPSELIPAFDQLNSTVQTQTLTDAQIVKIFTIVQHLIEHAFIKRYPKEKKSPDLLGAIKTITDIGRNIA